MVTRRFLVLGLILMAGLGWPLFSQNEGLADTVAGTSTDDAIFADGAFDTAVSTGQAASETSKLNWLGGMTLVSDTAANWLLVSDAYALRSGLSGKAFLKATLPDIASFYVSYDFSQLLTAVSNDNNFQTWWTLSGQNLTVPLFNLSEMYVSFDIGKLVFIRAGNQLLSWGASYFWSPADFVNFQPLDALAALDTRAGKSGVRVHVPFGFANVFMFTDLSETVSALGKSSDISKTVVFDFRADATFLGFNSGVVGSFGPSAPPRLGFTTTGNLLGFDLWGEYGAVLPIDDHVYSWALSAGLGKTLGQNQEWDIKGEFFTQSDGHDDAVLTRSTAFTPYRLGKYYGFLSVADTKLFGSDNTLGISGVMNFSDLSWTAAVNFGLRLPRLIPIDLSVRYNGGADNREFTLRTAGPSWTFEVRSVIQF